jgi:hypothetical protein
VNGRWIRLPLIQKNALVPPMTNPKLLAEPESTELFDRLTPDWQLHLHDGAIIDHILKVIDKRREGSDLEPDKKQR